jgi:type III secretory pathway component EscV
MKIILTILIIIAGVAIGLILGLGLFEGFELVLSMFILFPLIFIFGMILAGKAKQEAPDEDEKKKDRFSRWE